jgi:L-threonylcarbamoyladenylate synthase
VGGAQVEAVVAALGQGAVVVLPTDTVYGLVAVASDEAATARLFAVKQRSAGVPLAVLCASTAQALALAAPGEPEAVAAVAERWWPGPLTLVLPRRPGVALHLGEPATTIGLRVPDHGLVRSVAERVGPLAATSANRHGDPVVTTAADARAVFHDEVALIVDGGELLERSSTVVDATTLPWRVLREGPVSAEDIFTTGSDGGR